MSARGDNACSILRVRKTLPKIARQKRILLDELGGWQLLDVDEFLQLVQVVDVHDFAAKFRTTRGNEEEHLT